MSPEQKYYPVDELPMFETMVSDGIEYTIEQFDLFAQAKEKPHVLDDAIIDRGIKLFTDQLDFADCDDRQIARWRNQNPGEYYMTRINQFEKNVKYFRDLTTKTLDLLRELKKGTINRILEMSDEELGRMHKLKHEYQ